MRLACVPLPAPGGPSNTTGPMFCEVSIELTLTRSLLPGALGQLHNHPPTGRYGNLKPSLGPTAAATNASAAWSKSVVVAHDELCFNLRHRIHRHADHDQQRRAAEIKRYAQTVGHPGGQALEKCSDRSVQVIEMDSRDHPFWNEGNDDQIQSAYQSDPGQDLIDVVGGSLTRPNARNKPAILPHVVGNLVGVEDDRHIEVREENNAHRIKKRVERLAPAQPVDQISKVPIVAQAISHGLRHGQNGRGKNHRHHTARVDSQGQVRRLASHDFATDHALGVLHRNAAFAALHIHDERHDQDHDAHEQNHGGCGKGAPGVGANFVDQVSDAARKTYDDAGEYQERHAVADAAFGNLLAQPHDERTARGQSEHGHQDEGNPGVDYEIARFFETDGDAEGLNRTQDDG